MGPSHQYFNTPKPFQTFSVTHYKARPTVCDISGRNFIGLLNIDFNYLANFCWSLNSRIPNPYLSVNNSCYPSE